MSADSRGSEAVQEIAAGKPVHVVVLGDICVNWFTRMRISALYNSDPHVELSLSKCTIPKTPKAARHGSHNGPSDRALDEMRIESTMQNRRG